VGPPDGDASALLTRHNAGKVVDWNDARSARDMILEHYTAWTTGARRSGAAWEDIQEHNRQQQAYKMARCLDTACDVHRPAEASDS